VIWRSLLADEEEEEDAFLETEFVEVQAARKKIETPMIRCF
jgi:hypothetical protein